MAVEKKSVSLSGETLAQLDWIKQNVLHCEVPVPFSQLISMAIGLAYFKYNIDFNEACMENRFNDINHSTFSIKKTRKSRFS